MAENVIVGYKFNVPGPWTSDKMFVSCHICGIGILVMSDEAGIPAHEWCVEQTKSAAVALDTGLS